jgi:hypothetical protein
MACGTCQTYHAITGKLEACSSKCEARTLCNTAQSYGPYGQLVTLLLNQYYQATGYNAFIHVHGKSHTHVLQTTYANSNLPANSANLFVVWGPTAGQATAYTITYTNGVATRAYQAVAGGNQLIVLPQIPPKSAALTSAPTVSPSETKQLCAELLEICVLPGLANTAARCFQEAAAVVSVIDTLGATLPNVITAVQACETSFENGESACVQLVSEWCNCPEGEIECVLPDGSFQCCTCADYCFPPYQCVNNTCVLQPPCLGTLCDTTFDCCFPAGYTCCQTDESAQGGGFSQVGCPPTWTCCTDGGGVPNCCPPGVPCEESGCVFPNEPFTCWTA